MRQNQGVSAAKVRERPRTRQAVGRPPATSHADIERVAFDLFQHKGFEETSTWEIAKAVGISRRTLFRYFPSKLDIPWGRFDDGLSQLRAELYATPTDLPLWNAITEAVVAFNSYPVETLPMHRYRMQLILRTPGLQAHAALKYAEWRSVISEFAARRMSVPLHSISAMALGHASLAMSLSAYEAWLLNEGLSLEDSLRTASRTIEDLCRIGDE